MRVYLAGPMRGYPSYNFHAFWRAARDLRSRGHQVVSPAEIDAEQGFVKITDRRGADCTHRDTHFPDCRVELTDKFDLEKALERDFAAIDTVDAIVLLPGWEKSEGVKRELAHGGRRVRCYEYDPVRGSGLRLVQLTFIDDWQFTPAVSGNGTEEVRVVDPVTGGAKGQKLARFDLIPAVPLQTVAEHFGRGARKYEDRNWEKGYKWSLSFGALMRHAWAFWQGEDIDSETGSPHLAAVAFHALALLEFMHTHPEMDDRSTRAAD